MKSQANSQGKTLVFNSKWSMFVHNICFEIKELMDWGNWNTKVAKQKFHFATFSSLFRAWRNIFVTSLYSVCCIWLIWIISKRHNKNRTEILHLKLGIIWSSHHITNAALIIKNTAEAQFGTSSDNFEGIGLLSRQVWCLNWQKWKWDFIFNYSQTEIKCNFCNF